MPSKQNTVGVNFRYRVLGLTGRRSFRAIIAFGRARELTFYQLSVLDAQASQPTNQWNPASGRRLGAQLLMCFSTHPDAQAMT